MTGRRQGNRSGANKQNMPQGTIRETSHSVTIPKWLLKGLTGIAGFSLTIIVAFFVWYGNVHLPAKINEQIRPMSDKLLLVEKDTIIIKDALVSKELLVPYLKAATHSSTENLQNNLSLVNELLIAAEQKGLVIRPEDIVEAGRPLFERTIQDPVLTKAVWETTGQFANYRSFVNASLDPVPPETARSSPSSPFPPGASVIGSVLIKHHQELDGRYFVNSLFYKCTVIYNGGELLLQQVEFKDCHFVVTDSQKGRDFLQAVLASKEVNFQ